MRKSLRMLVAVLICIGFALTTLTSCNDKPMDTVWDGNYIYSSIYKCKTNGEGEEVLVDELSVDGKTYKISGVEDYSYIGETLFFGAFFKDSESSENTENSENFENSENSGKSENSRRHFIVKYSIKDNTHEIICRDSEFEGETYELSQSGSFFVKENKLYFSALFKKDEIGYGAFMMYDPQSDSLNTCYVTEMNTSLSYVGLYCAYKYKDYFVLGNHYDRKYYTYNKTTGETFVLDEDLYCRSFFENGYLIKIAGNDVFIISVEYGFKRKIFSVPTGEELLFQNREKENGKLYFITQESVRAEDLLYYTIRSSIYFYDIETDKLHDLTPRDASETKIYTYIGEHFFVEEDVYEDTRRVKDESGKYKTVKYFTEKNAKIYRFDENGNVEYLVNLSSGKKRGYITEKDDGNIFYRDSKGWSNSEKIFNPETREIKKAEYKKKTDEEEFTTYGVKCGDLYYIAERGGWFSANAIYRFDMKTKKVVRVQSRNVTPRTRALGVAKIDLVLPY